MTGSAGEEKCEEIISSSSYPDPHHRHDPSPFWLKLVRGAPSARGADVRSGTRGSRLKTPPDMGAYADLVASDIHVAASECVVAIVFGTFVAITYLALGRLRAYAPGCENKCRPLVLPSGNIVFVPA